jgi:hypothetical protein
MAYDPISVALKFGFLAVLYLFLLVIARSAIKDLRRTVSPAPDATGFHAVQPYAEGPRGADAWLVVERGGGLEADKRFDLIGGLSIGRSRDADVQIEDPNVSRRHAEIVQEGSVYWLIDLGSTNGTEVDGKRVQRARLDDGSRFTVGETTLTFSTERE